MPTRLLRERILTCEKVNRLTVKAELFYRRLMSVVDDHGRFYADARIVRAHCYPLKVDEVSEQEIDGFLKECDVEDLVVPFDAKGCKYLVIKDFGQQTRSN